MAKNQESLNKSLFDLLRSKGYHPVMLDVSGKEIPVPEEAEVFQFKFTKDDKEYGTVTMSIDGLHKLVIYFGDEVANSAKEQSHGNDDISWYQLLNQFKRFAKNHQLSFEIKNVDNLKYDMAKRDHMKKKEENLSEGYYPMGKKASYSDAVPTVKMIIQHTRQIEEGEQRYRNIARIFVENINGERFLIPTVKPGLARVYARHIAEGGTPYDERGHHINSLVEEYTKMAGFVRATRNGQFNESAQKLVNEGINHYTNLRETLQKMTGHRGYNAYFESYTPALMETEGEETNLNELFVQETLDPRIESVMPILNRLHKQISEMSEVNELAEWAESLTEAPGEESLAHNEKTEKDNLKDFDLEEATDLKSIPQEDTEEVTEMDDAEKAHMKIQTPAAQRKASGAPDWKVSTQDLAKEKERSLSGAEGLAALKAKLEKLGRLEEDPNEGLLQLEDAVEESGLQAYLGNKKYGKEGMDALRKAGREHASKEKMASIRAKYDKLDEEDVLEDLGPEQKRVGQLGPTEKITKSNPLRGKLVGANESVELSEMDKSQPSSDRGGESSGDPNAKGGKATPMTAKKTKKDFLGVLQKSVDKANKAKQDTDKKVKQHQVKEEVDTGEADARKTTPSSKKEQDKVFSKHRERMNKLRQEFDDEDKKKEVKEGQEDLESILRLIRK